MLTSCALSIEFHIILVIVLMTIHVFYISIIYYKLLPMFMIHVSFIHLSSSLFTCVMPAFFKEVDTGNDCFIHISSSLFTCVMPAFFKEVDTGNDCMYLRVLSLYATVISIYTILYDPNEVSVMTKTGLIIFVCCSNCIPNRHAHLFIYLIISKQLVLLHFQYISHIHE